MGGECRREELLQVREDISWKARARSIPESHRELELGVGQPVGTESAVSSVFYF